MVVIDDVMHVVKRKGIYVCRLADEIDPKRINAAIPNVQQRVLSLRSDSPLVVRTLLTAKSLLDNNALRDDFDWQASMRLAFSALSDLAAMQSIAGRVQALQDAAKIDDRRSKDRSIVLPSAGDIGADCKAFMQKADHLICSRCWE